MRLKKKIIRKEILQTNAMNFLAEIFLCLMFNALKKAFIYKKILNQGEDTSYFYKFLRLLASENWKCPRIVSNSPKPATMPFVPSGISWAYFSNSPIGKHTGAIEAIKD